ncbi:MAG: hypothetical protein QOE96_840 [Blastocatellia bacterium]|jgi:hypothetical protein|nr:hypothetical protein [Blastocatellia bacterium]
MANTQKQFAATTAREAAVEPGELVVQPASLEDCIADPARQKILRELLEAGDIPVFKSVASVSELDRLIHHLHGVMMNSFETYVPIREGVPNYMRLSLGDERALTPLWMVSWSFFSWNRDIFNLFSRYAAVYRLRNILSGLPPEMFISRRVERECAARIAVHFFPSGKGMLGAHLDPVGLHQLATATLLMTERGKDYMTGGFYLKRKTGERLFIEDALEPGDVYMCNPRCPHGVATVDEGSAYDPTSRAGRWNMVFPVNKIAGNKEVGDAINYEEA